MIKAIQTHYKGYKFRSRTEARWAVFFEKLGYTWEYEPEGYVLGDGTYYLPDFRLSTPCTSAPFFVEVKGTNVTENKKWKSFLASLDVLVRERSMLVSGDPYAALKIDIEPVTICPRCGAFTNDVFVYDKYEGYIEHWSCDQETPCGGGHPVYKDGLFAYQPHKGSLICKDLIMWQLKVKLAARRARQARFEHGETP